MTIESKASEYETQYGFPWELVISVLIELIDDCIENRQTWLDGRENVGRLQRAVLGWRLRRIAREEGLRVDIGSLRDQMIDDYDNLTNAEAEAMYAEIRRCCEMSTDRNL